MVIGLHEQLETALAGRYRVERELGRGGMAIVYLARDLKHGRRVAVKVLRPELATSVGAERFLREINVAAGVSHPNIVALYDSGEADDLLYYVMPYVDGESLRRRIIARMKNNDARNIEKWYRLPPRKWVYWLVEQTAPNTYRSRFFIRTPGAAKPVEEIRPISPEYSQWNLCPDAPTNVIAKARFQECPPAEGRAGPLHEHDTPGWISCAQGCCVAGNIAALRK